MATIAVENNVVTITVNGGVQPLSPSPAGSFTVPSITVDAYGRITAVTENNDVASATTQQQILATVDLIFNAIQGGVSGGSWSNP